MNEQLKQFIRTGGSPEKLLSNIALSNPMFMNLINATKQGNTQIVETFARNLCKEKGVDFDKEFAEFRSMFR